MDQHTEPTERASRSIYELFGLSTHGGQMFSCQRSTCKSHICDSRANEIHEIIERTMARVPTDKSIVLVGEYELQRLASVSLCSLHQDEQQAVIEGWRVLLYAFDRLRRHTDLNFDSPWMEECRGVAMNLGVYKALYTRNVASCNELDDQNAKLEKKCTELSNMYTDLKELSNVQQNLVKELEKSEQQRRSEINDLESELKELAAERKHATQDSETLEEEIKEVTEIKGLLTTQLTIKTAEKNVASEGLSEALNKIAELEDTIIRLESVAPTHHLQGVEGHTNQYGMQLANKNAEEEITASNLAYPLGNKVDLEGQNMDLEKQAAEHSIEHAAMAEEYQAILEKVEALDEENAFLSYQLAIANAELGMARHQSHDLAEENALLAIQLMIYQSAEKNTTVCSIANIIPKIHFRHDMRGAGRYLFNVAYFCFLLWAIFGEECS